MENANENLEIIVTKTADIINILLHEIALVMNTRVNRNTYKLDYRENKEKYYFFK